MAKYRIETGSFTAYRSASSGEQAVKLLYFQIKAAERGKVRSLRGRKLADATASWRCSLATRQPRH